MSILPHSKIPVNSAKLHMPTHSELASVLEAALKRNFADVSVSVVDCPDLTKAPFSLAAEGLCGSPRLSEVGGLPFLLPLPDRTRIYSADSLAERSGLPGAFVLGAASGPFQKVGVNCEGFINVKTGDKTISRSFELHKKPSTGEHLFNKAPTNDVSIMANLFLCEGTRSGKVLEVKAAKRTGDLTFTECMQQGMTERYGTQDRQVGIGGTFLMERGSAQLHMMPDFLDRPIETEASLNDWLEHYELEGPLVCFGHLLSEDPSGGELDLRLDHFHCFSEKKRDGGHFHGDTTPDEVMYRGYFNMGEYIYRLDQPTERHSYKQQ